MAEWTVSVRRGEDLKEERITKAIKANPIAILTSSTVGSIIRNNKSRLKKMSSQLSGTRLMSGVEHFEKKK
jgi:hypothetical protein